MRDEEGNFVHDHIYTICDPYETRAAIVPATPGEIGNLAWFGRKWTAETGMMMNKKTLILGWQFICVEKDGGHTGQEHHNGGVKKDGANKGHEEHEGGAKKDGGKHEEHQHKQEGH